MSYKYEFYLSEEDAARLVAIKEDREEDNLTNGEFAKKLLVNTLHSIHPQKVKFDEETGEIIKE